MGAGASAQPEAEEPQEKSPPTRRHACDASFATIQSMVTRQGVGFSRAKDVNEGTFDVQKGVLWCDGDGVYVGRHRNAQIAKVAWSDAVTFSTKKGALVLSSDAHQWRIELRGKGDVAAWLACYLHAFAPGAPIEQSITFAEWGQLGIAFGVFMKLVIPVVFSVEGAARAAGVRPASELVSVNGRSVASLGDDGDLLDFVSSASFPKTCVFRRRGLPGFHAAPGCLDPRGAPDALELARPALAPAPEPEREPPEP